MRPLFPYALIEGNADCSNKGSQNEHCYDIPAFSNLFELRDSMGLVQRYSLEPFMTPRRFFYPRVVIEFYQTMTTRGERHPTAIHFTIDGRQGILRTANIASAFHVLVALVNSADYSSGHILHPRRWSRSSPETHQLALFYSGGSFQQGFFLWTTCCGPICFLFSMLFKGKAPSSRPYIAFMRAFGLTLWSLL